MEPHGCVANWDGRSLTIWESSQGVYAVQSRVAEVLKLPLARVRVIGHCVGGGFGSKLEPGKYTVIAALMAKLSGRPVRLFLTREETYLSVGNRPPTNMTVKAGVKRDGTLTALEFSVLGTGGAYTAGGTSLADWLARDLYTCANVRTASTDVFINAGPARPFRAPGHPQGAWALEQMMDALAEAIGMDPVQLRLKNIPSFSQAREGNPPYTSTAYKECLELGAAAFGWEKARRETRAQRTNHHIRRGVGVAGGLWFVGGGRPPSTVIVKLFADGSANLNMGASDLGTGTKTVMAMEVAEELGTKPEAVQIEWADTGTTQYAAPSGGSKTVPTEAPAVRNAAMQVKQKLLEMAAAALKVDAAELVYRGRDIAVRRDPSKRIAVKDLEALKQQGVVVGIGYRGPNPKNMTTNPLQTAHRSGRARRCHRSAGRTGGHRRQRHRRERPRGAGGHPHGRRNRERRLSCNRSAHHQQPHPSAATGATPGGSPEGGMSHVTEFRLCPAEIDPGGDHPISRRRRTGPRGRYGPDGLPARTDLPDRQGRQLKRPAGAARSK
jgi:xanthine dehydrogenase YagR molybdenum-binding subunit